MRCVSTLSAVRLAVRSAVAVVVLLGLQASARASDIGDVERRVVGLVYEGRCDEALAKLEAVRREQDSARLALIEGQCRIRLRDYPGALVALDTASRLDPTLEDVAVYRGVALYQLEDHAEARSALNAARGHTSPVAAPQLELYSGMLLLQAGEMREAAQALDRARVMDAGQVEPIASFYAGLAWQSVGERELARESLLRVKAADPDGPWGQRAEELLSGRTLEERSWASIQAGLEYDSNVVLLGEAVPLPQGISNQSDGRAAWFLEGGAELFRKEKWSGGVAGTYAGNVQFELNEFDIQYPRVSGWLDYEIDPDHLLRMRYGIGHAWVDYSSFLFTQDATLSLYRNWGRAGNTEIGIGWTRNDYRYRISPVSQGNGVPGDFCPPGTPPGEPCSPPGLISQLARNRDGNSVRPLLLHRYRVRSIHSEMLRDIELRAGYAYERYFAEGTDWDYQSHDFVLGARALLVFGIELDTQLGFIYRPFTNPSSYPSTTRAGRQYGLSPNDRLDKIATVGASLEKLITEHVGLSMQYTYARAKSNVAVFDYSRHIVGAYVKYVF